MRSLFVILLLLIPGVAWADPKDEIAARFRADPRAEAIALRLFERDGAIADVETAHRFDGGYRGMIAIVPALPVASARSHLAWTDAAFADFGAFFAALQGATSAHVNYRYRDVHLRYFRSVGRTTPSAYALDWTIAYNVDGALMQWESGVRETLFHEIFHLNDQDHGEWSERALSTIYAALVAKCGTRTACLAPYAPASTKVRGVFYAFYPGNGVIEYAAELALRYYREQRAALSGAPIPAPFKCASPENARAWRLLAEEFFGGVDRTPDCPGLRLAPG